MGWHIRVHEISQRVAWAPGRKRQAPKGGCPRHSRCSSNHRRPVVNPMCLLGVPHVESLLAASRREGRHPGRKSRHRNSSIASCVTCVSVGDPTCFVSWMGSAPLPCGGQRRDGWDRAPMRVQEVNLSSHSPPLTASSVSSEPIMRLSCGCAMQEEQQKKLSSGSIQRILHRTEYLKSAYRL